MPAVRHLARGALVGAVLVATVAATGTAASASSASSAASAASGTPAGPARCSGYVALTFDDGPSVDTTLTLLRTLRANRVRATLFNIGSNAVANPSLVRAEVAAGMWIGNHSYTHPDLTALGDAELAAELGRTQQALRRLTGTTPRLFRPPYGATNATVRAAAARYGLTEIIWDVDTVDWSGVSADQIVRAAATATAGQVILMHDWPPNTIEAIPQIVAGLRSRNLCAGMISPVTGRAVAPR